MAGTRNWSTLYRELLDTYNRTVTTDGDRVKRAICEAAEYLESEEGAWFKQARFQVALTAGQSAYRAGEGRTTSTTGVPGDLEEWVGDKLVLRVDGSSDNLAEVRWGTVSYVEVDGAFVTYDEIGDETAQAGHPQVVSWWNGELIFRPTPSSSSDVVTGRYNRRLGAPFYRYASGWSFFKPDGQPIDDGWPDPTKGEENAWWGRGYAVLKYRAAYTFNKVHLKADEDAQEALMGYLEELERLRVSTDNRQHGAGFVRGYLPGWDAATV